MYSAAAVSEAEPGSGDEAEQEKKEMFGSLYNFMSKQRKTHITPKNADEPEKKIPDGFKLDEYNGEIVPLTENELRIDNLKSTLASVARQTLKMEKNKSIFPINYEQPESGYDEVSDDSDPDEELETVIFSKTDDLPTHPSMQAGKSFAEDMIQRSGEKLILDSNIYEGRNVHKGSAEALGKAQTTHGSKMGLSAGKSLDQ